MKALLTFVGVLLVAAGLLFAGQGAGIIDWPSGSFMLGADRWVTYGLILAGVGLLFIILGWGRRSL
ncbi:MAG: hypothetical protein ACK4SZ_03540 [Allosphingosinicella sp.]|uniref:hypothetical protein n=1 Tax=Allosphingosinicella sp. TaxID=2823234 RepID=UPI0039367690